MDRSMSACGTGGTSGAHPRVARLFQIYSFEFLSKNQERDIFFGPTRLLAGRSGWNW